MRHWRTALSVPLAMTVLLPGGALGAQETPPSNRSVLFGMFPEPLPEGRAELAFEITNQWLRPNFDHADTGRTFAVIDGEDWQLTGDIPWRLGPGVLNLRLRAAYRFGGLTDQLIQNWHHFLGVPNGMRDTVRNFALDYHLERDGVVVADLSRPGLKLMDTDLSFLLPFGDRQSGGRVGGSVQAPTGDRKDFSGDGGWDGMAGAAAWRSYGSWTLHGQLERVFIGLPSQSPYRLVLEHRGFSRAWGGLGHQGQGAGIWSGLGIDVTLCYYGSPYRVGIPRVDHAGWQQHWTFHHRRLPAWRFGFSEKAGTYTAPEITGFVVRSF
jgi:Protein of unknown function (DUF3187)